MNRTSGDLAAWLGSTARVRRLLAAASLLCTLLLIYASLLPLTFRPLPWADAREAWRAIPWLSLDIFHRSDWVANALVVLPAGVLASAAVDWGRTTNWQLLVASPLIAFGLALVVIGIELVQVWFPPRTVSLNDIVAGFSGAALGPLLWVLIGPFVERAFRHFARLQRKQDRLAWFCAVWLVCLLILTALPLDLVLNQAEWQQKIAAGRLNWIPFSSSGMDWSASIGTAFRATLSFAPIGLYCSIVLSPAKSRWMLWLLPIALQLIELPLYSKTFSYGAILGGWVGGWSAYYLSRRCDRLRDVIARPVVWAIGWCAAAIFAAWILLHRYDRIIDDPAEIASRFSAAWRWPLLQYYVHSEYRAYTTLLEMLGVFAALGACSFGLSRTVTSRWQTLVKWSMPALVIGLAASVELSQVYLPPLIPDMADVIVASIGYFAGYLALRIVWGPNESVLQIDDSCDTASDQTCSSAVTSRDRKFNASMFAVGTLLLAYGSLVPFHFRAMQFDVAWKEFVSLFDRTIFYWGETADWSLNLTIMIPISFFAMGGLAAGRDRWSVWLAAPFALLACVIVSLAVEFAQMWCVGRVASSRDVAAQTIGAGLGVVAWIALGQRFSAWRRSFFQRSEPLGRIEWFLQAYVMGLVIYSVVPVNVIMSPSELLHKYRSGLIELVPFSTNYGGLLNSLSATVSDIMLFIPVGMYASVARVPGGQALRTVPQALLLGLIFNCAIECAQLFIVGRYTSTTDVILGFVGVTIGVMLLQHLRGERRDSLHSTMISAHTASLWLLGTILYVLLLAIILWAPYDFSKDFSLARQRFVNCFDIPFARMHEGSDLTGLFAAVRKILWFIPLGVLSGVVVVRAPARIPRRLLIALAVAGIIVVAFAIEIGHVFLPSRVADLTDVSLTAGGGLLGLLATRFAFRRPGSHPVQRTPTALRPSK